MNYFFIEPEVAGGWGKNVVADVSIHPPQVRKLHYEFEGWMGDALLDTFPCVIATKEAADALASEGVTGIDYAKVEVSTSDLFRHLHPTLNLPPFVWLQIKGKAGRDDFGDYCDARGERPWTRHVISDRALGIIRPFGLNHADIEPFDAVAP